MFERFTLDAREVVISAQAHARRLHAGEIGARHLLLALCDEAHATGWLLADHHITVDELEPLVESHAVSETIPGLSADDADALRNFGIDIDQVAESIKAHFDAASPQPRRRSRRRLFRRSATEHIPFTSEAKRALENSLRVAIRLGHNSLTPMHILGGLLEPGQREVPDILRAAAVDPAQFRRTVEEQLRKAA